MADNKIFPINHTQNPAPSSESGLEWDKAVRAQVENILADFLRVLPDNYVSQVSGPSYMLNFQAVAEQIAKVQLSAQEVFSDSGYDFTRSEFLFEILGSLVFPRGREDGIPTIDGDVSYRDFLKSMVLLLLRGATPDSQREGAQLLTSSQVSITEKSVSARRTPGALWGLSDQFEFELDVVTRDGTDFPDEDPFVLQENVRLALRALRPAHTIYEYRHLFLDAFGSLFEDSAEHDLESYHYEDFRKFCDGTRRIRGYEGETLPGLRSFRDVSRSFKSVKEGAWITVEDGPNAGRYRVLSVVGLPFPDDATPRPYTTSPTSLQGYATVHGGVITDGVQDWSQAVEGEVLTFQSGPNSGRYRLDEVLGLDGGPVGHVSASSSSVTVCPGVLRLSSRMKQPAAAQTYEVDVDRLGVKVPVSVTEDVSLFFTL